MPYLHFTVRTSNVLWCCPPLYVTVHCKGLLWSALVGWKVRVDVAFHWPSSSCCDWKLAFPEWLQVKTGREVGQEWDTEQDAVWPSITSLTDKLMGFSSSVTTGKITIAKITHKLRYRVTSKVVHLNLLGCFGSTFVDKKKKKKDCWKSQIIILLKPKHTFLSCIWMWGKCTVRKIFPVLFMWYCCHMLLWCWCYFCPHLSLPSFSSG